MIEKFKASYERITYSEQQLLLNNIDTFLQNYTNPISLLREYEILKIENAKFEFVKSQIYNSLSYRIGSLILSPLKLLKKIIKIHA